MRHSVKTVVCFTFFKAKQLSDIFWSSREGKISVRCANFNFGWFMDTNLVPSKEINHHFYI